MSDPEFFFGVIGIPWCREEDYPAFVAIFEDRKDLPRTWQGFAEAAEKAEEHWKAQGSRTIRVYIDPRTFPVWCKVQGCRIDAQARHEFAREAAIRKAERH
jgi:hypothetical protein